MTSPANCIGVAEDGTLFENGTRKVAASFPGVPSHTREDVYLVRYARLGVVPGLRGYTRCVGIDGDGRAFETSPNGWRLALPGHETAIRSRLGV
jgi:hypothetical protein